MVFLLNQIQSFLEIELLYRLLAVTAVWVLVYILVRCGDRRLVVLEKKADEIKIDPRELRTLGRLANYTLITLGAIATIAILQLTSLLYSVMTAAGVIGIAVGFAVKDVAANFVSGILILLDRPFVPGDAIKVGEYSGTVRRISLRSTEIATFEGPVVIMPNQIVATTPVINYTVNAIRRADITVSLTSDADLKQAVDAMRTVAEAEEQRVQDEDIQVFVSGVREYVIDLTLQCYFPNDVWFAAQNDLRRAVIEEFKRRGLELAVPMRKNL
ncbi:MAG: mechanosensitive ion channel family protein [Anaerolineae bacterium]|jgi:small-conductance mechanosensitive channel|nr:mechanosensitive ion channel family protein [Anaerolineae bacterium]MDH7475408.1 mechanosensitive ion channel family protein [Anaerolineae bacterium]